MVSETALDCLVDQISPQLMQRLHLTSTALNQDSAVATRAADGERCLLHASKKKPLKLSWQRAVKMGSPHWQSGQFCSCFSLPAPEKNPISPLLQFMLSRSCTCRCPHFYKQISIRCPHRWRGATASLTRDAARWRFYWNFWELPESPPLGHLWCLLAFCQQIVDRHGLSQLIYQIIDLKNYCWWY